MITNGNRRADKRVRIETLSIRERNEHLAKYFSIRLSQDADASDARWIAAVFDRARFYERKPIHDRIESSDQRPHFLRRRVHNAADKNPRHFPNLLRSHRARAGFEFLQEHALSEQFRKDDWLFVFPGIKHIERHAWPAKVL